MADLITLTTDFGAADGFVGAMKGVILTLAPQATIVDIAHDIPPHDVRAGAFALETALPHFPPGSIHVVVVDPGVGSDRDALLVVSPHGMFLAPDNGVLTSVTPADGRVSIYALDRPEFWRSRVSNTFHGRDVFAPVAAHLATGVPPAALGTPREDMVRLPWPQPCRDGNTVTGEVIHVDRFGNLITNLRLADLGSDPGRARVRLRGATIWGIASHYAAGNGIIALVNSAGRIEIALPSASAAQTLGVGVGEIVHVLPAQP